MPESLSPAGAALEALGYALFIAEGETLRLAAEPPPWLRSLWPGLTASRAALDAAEASPFLENFLIDAADSWTVGGDRRAKSGAWIERDADGNEVALEATALTLDGQSALLIKFLGEDYDEKQAVLQKARENVLAYQKLNSEVQKKEILLHYLTDDMNGSLGNIITSLRLVELEQDPVKIRQLLDLAGQATRQQQSLINRVMGTFAAELEALYGRYDDDRASADLRAIASRAAAAAEPQFEEKGVRFAAPAAEPDKAVEVAADAERIERILANLLENALQVTPEAGEVSVQIEEEAEAALVRVQDGGDILPEDVREQLFGTFQPLPASASPAALRLHYCRIAVDYCEGEMGCEPGETGGNRVWVRLPKFSAAQ